MTTLISCDCTDIHSCSHYSISTQFMFTYEEDLDCLLKEPKTAKIYPSSCEELLQAELSRKLHKFQKKYNKRSYHAKRLISN